MAGGSQGHTWLVAAMLDSADETFSQSQNVLLDRAGLDKDSYLPLRASPVSVVKMTKVSPHKYVIKKMRYMRFWD